MCGCHGHDFVAEGSDELLTRLDAIMSTEFEAKLLPRGSRASSGDQASGAHVALARGGSELPLEQRIPVRRGTVAVAWTCRRQSGDEEEDSGNEGDGQFISPRLQSPDTPTGTHPHSACATTTQTTRTRVCQVSDLSFFRWWVFVGVTTAVAGPRETCLILDTQQAHKLPSPDTGR